MKTLNTMKLHITIGLLIITLLSCGKPLSPEEKARRHEVERQKINEKFDPIFKKDIKGNFHVDLPEQQFGSRYKTSVSKTKLVFPSYVRAEIRRVRSYLDVRDYHTIYVHFKLDNLTEWETPPEIPNVVAEEVKIYSGLNKFFGRKVESVNDPKVRDRIYKGMKYRRANKRVRFKVYEGTFSSHDDLLNDAFITKTHFFRSGFVSGLQRYSRRHCFTSAQLQPNPQNPHNKNYLSARYHLKNKDLDDSSPDGCVYNYYNSIFISPESSKKNDWVHIACSPQLKTCTATFEAASRLVEVDLLYKDIELWRETIDPIRKQINSFKINI